MPCLSPLAVDAIYFICYLDSFKNNFNPLLTVKTSLYWYIVNETKCLVGSKHALTYIIKMFPFLCPFSVCKTVINHLLLASSMHRCKKNKQENDVILCCCTITAAAALTNWRIYFINASENLFAIFLNPAHLRILA